jgi:hypothetical protein
MDGGVTAALIISSIVAASAAAVSYSEAKSANRRAVKAAEDRNAQLDKVYAAESAQLSKKAEREQRRLNIERHLATESLAASVASSGIITTAGSAALMSDMADANYGQAARELTQESNAQQQAAVSNLGMAQMDTYNTMAMNYRNPLMEGFQTGSQTFSLVFGTYASAASLAGTGTSAATSATNTATTAATPVGSYGYVGGFG